MDPQCLGDWDTYRSEWIFIRRNKTQCSVYDSTHFFIMSLPERNSSEEQSLEQDAGLEASIGPEPVAFDWEKRWLKGHEYHHILQNIEAYCERFGFQKYEPKCHPKEIYSEPVNGMIYFVRGKGVGQDFGFPRMELLKKKYRWKKMNFTTDLPKRKPYVTYVVASAMRAHLIEESENAEFRMHAVIPYCEGRNSSQDNEYILCHVRAVDHKRDIQDWGYRSCFVEEQVDFYRLFAFLHNYTTAQRQ